MASGTNHRDLSAVRATGSTARVLNLAFIHERFGDTAEWRDRPFFRHRRLNRAVFIKHALRRDELDLFVRPPITTTKIVLPYSTTDLSLGGVSLLFGQQGFESSLREGVGGFADRIDFDADMHVLEMLNSLPSFDPFVMRERLRQSEIEPAKCYFDISEADLTRMRDHVADEIVPLVRMAFRMTGVAAQDLAARLADKLMTDETAKALEPLRDALNLSGRDYAEGVFAWKGFLYYAWSMSDFAARMRDLKAAIAKAPMARATPAQMHEIGRMRANALANLDRAMMRIHEQLDGYRAAFAALTQGAASQFRNFLLDAPEHFIPMGEAIGVIKHIASYWGYRFPPGGAAPLSVEEALDLFEDFDRSLGALAFSDIALERTVVIG